MFWVPILPSRCFPSMSTERLRRSRASVLALLFLLDLLAWEVTGLKSTDHRQKYNLRKGLGEAGLCKLAYKALWSDEDSHLQQVLLHQHIDAQWPSGLSDKVIAELLQHHESKALLGAHAKQTFLDGR